jgi:tyrosinase
MAAKLGKAVSNIFGRSKKQTTKKKSRTKRNVDDEYSDDLVCTRKEIHCLTPGELKGLSMTLNRWHHEPIDEESGRTGHEMFIGYHRFAEAPGAHFGPCFIPWHRICLARAEQAWKNMGCGYSCIPYLDWSLLVGLHLPADSCLFSDDYFGASNGDVTTGIAGDWKIFYPECGERLNRDCLRTSDARDYLITEEVEYEILEEGYTYGRLCYSAHPKLEMNHGYFHSMMGGQMDMLSCAPHDPFFWMHHAGVDRLYQKARDRHEEEGTPVWAEYPDPASRHMGYDDPCLPFDTHSDPCDCGTGLDEEYEDLAQYEEPPKRCWVDSDCACKDNPYDCLVAALWCKNTSYYEEDWRCTSKIKIGGNCRGFRDSSCFQETKCGYNRAYCHSRTQVCTC